MLYFIEEATKRLNKELPLNFDWADIMSYVDLSGCDDIDSIWDVVVETAQDNRILDVDFHYYGSSMEYLMKNDPSLNESLELANDLGFAAEKLNSCILASLLASRELSGAFYECEDKFNEILEECILNDSIEYSEFSEKDKEFLKSFDEDTYQLEILIPTIKASEEYKEYCKGLNSQEADNLAVLLENDIETAVSFFSDQESWMFA